MIHVKRITLNKNELRLEIGDQYSDLNATVYPSNATKPCVTWTSSNVKVAAVHRETGHILTTGVGTAIIYACACDSSKVCASCYVTVTPVKVKKLIISESGMALYEGQSAPITATALPDSAADTSLTWISSNPDIAYYVNGRIYGKKKGRADITVATNDGSSLTRTCNVWVDEFVPVESIEISSSYDTIVKDTSTYLNVRILPKNASCCCVKWISSNPSVAAVNPETGLVIGRSVGTAVITAQACDGSGVKASYAMNVIPEACVCSVSVSPETVDVAVGEEAQLKATILPVNATEKAVTWTSDDTSVAIVHPVSGEVRGENPGITTVRVTTKDGGYQAECTVRVGHKAILDGHTVMVFAEDEVLADELGIESSDEEILTGLNVYADGTLLTSAIEEDDGDITVCIGEIAYLLCNGQKYFDPGRDIIRLTTMHFDLEQSFTKEYHPSELGLCPIDHINDRISLKTFIEDMGYSTKYSGVKMSNGAVLISIQGYDHGTQALDIPFDSLASLAIGFIPVLGETKDVIEAVYGRDIITGEELSIGERLLNVVFSFVPLLSRSVVRVAKCGVANFDDFVKYVDDLPDVQKAIIHSMVWESLRPMTRGLCIEAEFAVSVYKLSEGWHHIGEYMNGFFPVIDFLAATEKLEDTLVISMKTLDPRLYKLADGFDTSKIKSVVHKYIDTLSGTRMTIDGMDIKNRQLDLVIPIDSTVGENVWNSLENYATHRGVNLHLIRK